MFYGCKDFLSNLQMSNREMVRIGVMLGRFFGKRTPLQGRDP